MAEGGGSPRGAGGGGGQRVNGRRRRGGGGTRPMTRAMTTSASGGVGNARCHWIDCATYRRRDRPWRLSRCSRRIWNVPTIVIAAISIGIVSIFCLMREYKGITWAPRRIVDNDTTSMHRGADRSGRACMRRYPCTRNSVAYRRFSYSGLKAVSPPISCWSMA